MLGTYRQNDLAIIIQQDNQQKRVDVISMNDNARELLGYSETIIGKPLGAILPERIASLLQEYVDYEEDGHDVADVLGRVIDFNLLGVDGEAYPFFPKFIPAESRNGKVMFHLVLQPRAAGREGAVLRAAMQKRQPALEATPLPRQQLLSQIEAWQNVEEFERLPAAVGLLMVDQHEQIIEWHGAKALAQLIEHFAANVRQKLRAYDQAMVLDGNMMALTLLDVQPETARLVLNRLRWEAATLPVQLPGVGRLSVTLSAVFAPLDLTRPPEAQLQECERLLQDGHRQAPNQLWSAAA